MSEFEIYLRYDDYEREKYYAVGEYLQLKIKYSGFELNHQSDESLFLPKRKEMVIFRLGSN